MRFALISVSSFDAPLALQVFRTALSAVAVLPADAAALFESLAGAPAPWTGADTPLVRTVLPALAAAAPPGPPAGQRRGVEPNASCDFITNPATARGGSADPNCAVHYHCLERVRKR